MRQYTARDAALTSRQPTTVEFTASCSETLRISAYSDDVFRVRFCPDSTPRLDRTWAVVGPDGDTPRSGRLKEHPNAFEPAAMAWDGRVASSGETTVSVDLSTLTLAWSYHGQSVLADLPDRAYTYDRSGRAVWHYLRRNESQRHYGAGERSGNLDRTGRRLRLASVDALGYNAETSDPLYKHIPFYITLDTTSSIAYGIFYDTPANGVLDFGAEIDAFWGEYRYAEFNDGDLDYYVLFGPTIADVLEKYTRLTGRPAQMPEWALGYLGSTMQYTEEPDADSALRRFVADCAANAIPCRGFHFSSGYTTDEQGRRRTFCWNTDKIPDAKGLIAHFRDAGQRILANVKPYLLESHPHYSALRDWRGFIRAADSDEPLLGQAWPGGRHAKATCAYVDFTSETGYDWWVDQATASLLDYGITSLWNDNNEFQIWDDAARCDGFGDSIPLGMARPTQTLLMARASYEATKAHQPDEIPLVITRAGSAGIQRYAQTWTGDNRTSWHTLRWNIPMGLGLSLSGVPNFGHDIGGFDGPPPDPELLIRWVQCGVFLPRFTIHSWNTDDSVTSPWMYAESLPIVRAWIKYRDALIPLLKQLTDEAHQTGMPVNRPTVLHFTHDPNTRVQQFEFLLGDSILVAPVLEPDARTREVYLPAGADWRHIHDGVVYAGGQSVIVDAPLEHIPLFIREGSTVVLPQLML